MRVGWIVCGGCIRYHDLDGTVGISVYGFGKTYDYYYDLTGAFLGEQNQPVNRCIFFGIL